MPTQTTSPLFTSTHAMTMRPNTFSSSLARTVGMLAFLAGAASLGLVMGGCQRERSDAPPRQFLPDMDDSPKFKPQTETAFFSDGRAMRQPVSGTVAFGGSSRVDGDRAGFAKLDVGIYQGIDPAGKPLAEGEPAYLKSIPAGAVQAFADHWNARGAKLTSPAESLAKMVERGQERFNIYCAVCHGYHGEGGDPTNGTGGIVGRRWRYLVPSYHDPKYRDRAVKTGQDGYLFHVILQGVPAATSDLPPKMPGYADKVNELDAWAIVMYVRTLQAAWKDGTSAQSPTGAASASPLAMDPANTDRKEPRQ